MTLKGMTPEEKQVYQKERKRQWEIANRDKRREQKDRRHELNKDHDNAVRRERYKQLKHPITILDLATSPPESFMLTR